ncbi:MAG TPA: cytochrome P450 [Gaiellales bacterium]
MARLDGVDLLDHDLFAEREPWDVFERLRRDAPVYWHDEPGGRGFWCVTRYDDVVAVLKDTATFSSELGGVAQIEDMQADELAARRNFMETDPPLHTQWRRLFARDFAPRSLAQYEPFLRELTRRLLDEALPLGEFDFVERIAAPIPIRVLGHILGVPEEHLDRLVELGDAMLVDTDPELARVVAGSPEHDLYRFEPFGSPDARELCEIGRGIYAERREHPKDDILSLVAHAEIAGCPLDERALDNTFAIMVVAGNETTRQAMALGMLALMEFPDQLELLRSGEADWPRAVDELIRYASPVWYFRRTATRDVEVEGTTIREGDKVVVWFGSANRDPERFPDPDVLDLTRPRDVHAAFGRGGPHFCLGAHLARLELTVLFQELLPRLGTIELTGPVSRLRSNFGNGLKRMPVRVTPPSGEA